MDEQMARSNDEMHAKTPTPDQPRAPGMSRAAFWLAVAATVLVAVVVRIPAFRFPLDQDCGEYAYCAQEWARGGLPYRDGTSIARSSMTCPSCTRRR